jgi:hypothetical protein
MSWFSKPKAAPSPSPISSAPREQAKDDRAAQLTRLLSEYEKEYYAKVKEGPTQEVRRAKQIVAEARDFVSHSRIGYAVCRPIFEHVMYWPAWAERDDFSQYAHEPFSYISGEKSSNNEPRVITFSYNSYKYTLRFKGDGMHSWGSGDDMNTYGRLEFLVGERHVLGLDIAKDLSKEWNSWRMLNVYCFAPGPWMKETIEMGAYIDATREKRMSALIDNDAVKRASNITLPE